MNTNKDQDYMDYVESFLINDGDIYSYDNNNSGNQKEIMNVTLQLKTTQPFMRWSTVSQNGRWGSEMQ